MEGLARECFAALAIIPTEYHTPHQSNKRQDGRVLHQYASHDYRLEER